MDQAHEGPRPAAGDEEANPDLLALAESMRRDEQPGAPPGGGGPGAAGDAPPEQDSRAAYGMARGFVGAVCGLVTRRWPGAVYTEDEQHTMATLLSPVIMKRLDDPWMLKYREEFAAAGFAIYMGYAGFQRQAAATPAAAAPREAWDGPLRAE